MGFRVVAGQLATGEPHGPGLGAPAIPQSRLNVEGVVAVGKVKMDPLVSLVRRLTALRVVPDQAAETRQGQVAQEGAAESQG